MSKVEKVYINTHIEKSFGSILGSKQKSKITLEGIPATIEIDNNGNYKNPIPNDNAKNHAIKNLADPIFVIISKYKDIQDMPTPDIKIVFRSTSVENSDTGKKETELSEIQLDDIRFPIETARWSLDKVILPAKTKEQLEIVLGLIKFYPLMYEQWNLKSLTNIATSSITLNFYGASGTGKTLCAEAVAKYLNKSLLRVNYSELESKFVGDMNKNLVKVFERAKKFDSVLFFDEADSILGKRLSSVTQAAEHGINMARSVMLIELERFKGVVIFASNFVQNYDTAFARRILHHINFLMPDDDCRKQIFKLHIPNELPIQKEVTFEKLSELSEGLSGGDIKNVVLKAAAKAAFQNLPDFEKVVTLADFEISINEIKNANSAIKGQKTDGQAWLDKKLDNLTDKTEKKEYC